MDDSKAYERAKRRVDMLKAFYLHLLVYISVMLGLLLIDIFSGEGWWFYWPMIGWGIAVAVHGAVVLVTGGQFGRDWEERKIHEYMERDRRPDNG
jgi:hypothetical protein